MIKPNKRNTTHYIAETRCAKAKFTGKEFRAYLVAEGITTGRKAIKSALFDYAHTMFYRKGYTQIRKVNFSDYVYFAVR